MMFLLYVCITNCIERRTDASYVNHKINNLLTLRIYEMTPT